MATSFADLKRSRTNNLESLIKETQNTDNNLSHESDEHIDSDLLIKNLK